jgi:hypothetical protein
MTFPSISIERSGKPGMETGIDPETTVLNAPAEIDWEPHRALYDDIQFAVPTPLEQAWTYGDAIDHLSGNRILRGIVEIDRLPAATLQGARRTLVPGFSMVRLTRGPVIADPAFAPAVCHAVTDALKLRKGTLLFMMPDIPERDTPPVLAGSRKRPMTTGYATAWLDVSPEPEALMENMRSNWRGALRKALADPPVLRFSSRAADIDEFTKVYLEDRRVHRYSGPSAALVKALSEAFGKDVRLYRAMEHGETVASSLFLRHGRSATYYLSWTTERGRELNAAHFILWEAVRSLRDDGVHWLDLGGLDARAPGLARFKLGLGARCETYSGTWL